MRLLSLILLMPLLAFASLSDTDRQEFWSKNLLKNGGFENGLGSDSHKWAASGGALALVTNGSNLLRGNDSATWDSSAAAQTLSYSALAIPNGLKGSAGIGMCKIMTPSGSATHLLEAFDGSTVLKSTTITSSTTPTYSYVSFTFPASGNIVLRLKSVNANEPLIAIDNCYLGAADEVFGTIQSRTFTAGSTTFVVPAGAKNMKAQACGAGASGGGGGGGNNTRGGGGGGGGEGTDLKSIPLPVTSGDSLAITVGAGGVSAAGGVSHNSATAGVAGTVGNAGGNTTIQNTTASGPVYTFLGGAPGTAGAGSASNAGGTGGATLSTFQYGTAGGRGSVPSVQNCGPQGATATLSGPMYAGGSQPGCQGGNSFNSGGSGGAGGAGALGAGGAGGLGTDDTGGGGAAGGTGGTGAGFCAGGGGGGGNVNSNSGGGPSGAGAPGTLVLTWVGPPS